MCIQLTGVLNEGRIEVSAKQEEDALAVAQFLVMCSTLQVEDTTGVTMLAVRDVVGFDELTICSTVLTLDVT